MPYRKFGQAVQVACQHYPNLVFHCGSKESYFMRYRGVMEAETIVAAACQDSRGVIWTVDPPGRHYHLIRAMDEFYREKMIPKDCANQGFMTSHGFYIDRAQARRIAEAQKQLLATASRSTELFSEDLW